MSLEATRTPRPNCSLSVCLPTGATGEKYIGAKGICPTCYSIPFLLFYVHRRTTSRRIVVCSTSTDRVALDGFLLYTDGIRRCAEYSERKAVIEHTVSNTQKNATHTHFHREANSLCVYVPIKRVCWFQTPITVVHSFLFAAALLESIE